MHCRSSFQDSPDLRPTDGLAPHRERQPAVVADRDEEPIRNVADMDREVTGR